MISQSHKNFNSGELIRLYPSLIVQKYTYELPIAPGCIYTYKVKILQENQTKQIIIGKKKNQKNDNLLLLFSISPISNTVTF